MTTPLKEPVKRIVGPVFEPSESDYKFLEQQIQSIEITLKRQLATNRESLKILDRVTDSQMFDKFENEENYYKIMMICIDIYRKFLGNFFRYTLRFRLHRNQGLYRELSETWRDITSHIFLIKAIVENGKDIASSLDYTDLGDVRSRNSYQTGYYIDRNFYGKSVEESIGSEDILTRGLDLFLYSQSIQTLPQRTRRSYHGELKITLGGNARDDQRIMINLYGDEGNAGASVGSQLVSFGIGMLPEGRMQVVIEFPGLSKVNRDVPYLSEVLQEIYDNSGSVGGTHHWNLRGDLDILTQEQAKDIFCAAIRNLLSNVTRVSEGI